MPHVRIFGHGSHKSQQRPEPPNRKAKPLRILRQLAFATTLVAASAPALAQQSTCATDPHGSGCGLDSTLHLLRYLAIALALILASIIIIAIAAYRKNRNAKLTPND